MTNKNLGSAVLGTDKKYRSAVLMDEINNEKFNDEETTAYFKSGSYRRFPVIDDVLDNDYKGSAILGTDKDFKSAILIGEKNKEQFSDKSMKQYFSNPDNYRRK